MLFALHLPVTFEIYINAFVSASCSIEKYTTNNIFTPLSKLPCLIKSTLHKSHMFVFVCYD